LFQKGRSGCQKEGERGGRNLAQIKGVTGRWVSRPRENEGCRPIKQQKKEKKRGPDRTPEKKQREPVNLGGDNPGSGTEGVLKKKKTSTKDDGCTKGRGELGRRSEGEDGEKLH